MRLSNLIAFSLLAVPAAELAAQNVIVNGNFQTSSTSFQPWVLTRASNTKNARIAQQKVGFPDAMDLVFAAQSSTASGGDIGIEQQFTVTPAQGAGDWWLSAIVTNPNYSTDGITRYRTTIDRQATGAWTNVATIERTISTKEGPIQDIVRLAPATYRVRFSVRAGDVVGKDFYIDDCVVRKVALPVPLFESIRSGRQEFTLINLTNRDPRTVTVLLMSLQRLSRPIQIPGFQGFLELDPFRDGGVFVLGAGTAGWSRRFDRQMLAMIGRTLFFQAAEVSNTLRIYRFGSRTGWFENK